MSSVLLVVSGAFVAVGSVLIALAPVCRGQERAVRICGVCLTLPGAILGIIVGLGAARKTDALLKGTAKIVDTSGKTLGAVNETLSTSKGILKETRTNLDRTNETLQVASKVSSRATDAASYTSGGNSFPVVFCGALGNHQIGFYLEKLGKYPLYRLSISVGRPYRTSPAAYELLGVSRQFPELDEVGAQFASHPIWFRAMPSQRSTFFAADMSARNGHWQEVINVRRTSSGITSRWVVFGTVDAFHPYTFRKILDDADQDFPAPYKKSKIYPVTSLDLPRAPQP